MELLALKPFISFLSYFGVSVFSLFVFALIYLKFTPYNELILIKRGNIAASISYSGALIGFILPLASTVIHSISISDMILWAIVAMITQIFLFFIVRVVLFKDIKEKIENNNIASALMLATLSVIIGVLNAASLSY